MNNQAASESSEPDEVVQQPASPAFYPQAAQLEQPKIKEPPKPKKAAPVRIKQPPPPTGQIKDLYVGKKFAGKEKKITSLGPNVGGFSNPKLKKKKTTRRSMSPSKSPGRSPRRDGLIANSRGGALSAVGIADRPPTAQETGARADVVMQDADDVVLGAA